MLRAGVACIFLMLAGSAAQAQSWVPWDQGAYRPPVASLPKAGPPASTGWLWGDDDDEPRMRPSGPKILQGGARPSISAIPPRRVSFVSNYPAGSIVIDTAGRQLLLIQSPREALRYPVAVGREGFTWTGTQTISRVSDWPDWHPPAEMRKRDPRLPEMMTGGVHNPLGAKALYLGNTLYRIHGTNDASTIGRAGSSGCFRMMNGHVIDLARRVGVGTRVTVVNRLSSRVAGVD
jgi:lipoprotein-anchoring transpeptidase ErfK/SrfK